MAQMIYERLENFDPEIDGLIKLEEKRQKEGLELIASENFTSISVLQANSSILTNKYSEGQVGQRYYGGNEYIDAIETLCKKRALELFKLDPNIWDVNVQALSGTAANLSVYTGLIGKDGKLMGLDLPSGGHLSHGFKTPKKKISASSVFFNSRSYKNGPDGQIDFEALKKEFDEFKPDLLICGGSACPRDIDYKRFREIAKDAYLMMDMAHVSGLIAAGLLNNPFEYCDVVTTTTHKILRGPRSSMIFYRKKVVRKGEVIDLKSLIDFAVFPSMQGGPHNQKIGALAVALKQANTEEYREYAKNVINNTKMMADEFKKMGYNLYTDGTETHLILICLENVGGQEVEKLCEMANIYLNKNCISTDKSPLRPTGIRIGSPALTTRGLKGDDFVKVSKFIDEGIKLATEISNLCQNNETGKINEELFLEKATKDPRVEDLKKRVTEFVVKFDIPQFNYRSC